MKSSEAQPREGLAERISKSLPEIARFVRRRMGRDLQSRESVSDIVQSTARELLRSPDAFEDRGEASFQRWLRVAAEHKIRNRARHWRAFGRNAVELIGSASREETPAAKASPSEDALLSEERAQLARAIAALAPDHALVIRRVQIEGASYDEVALEVGRSPEAVRKLLARALARLSSTLMHELGR